MKKRILSALMALCLAFSVSSAALAQGTEGADSAAPTSGSTQTLDDSTPATTPAATGTDDAASADGNGESGGNDEQEQEAGAEVAVGTDATGDGQQSQIPADGAGDTETGSTDATTGGAEGAETGDENTTPAGNDANVPEGEGTGAPENTEQPQGDPGEEQPSAGNGITSTQPSTDVPTTLVNNAQSRLTPSENGDSTFELKWWRNNQSVTVHVILWDSEADKPIAVEQGTLDVYDRDDLSNPSAWTFSENTLPQIDNYTYDTIKGVTYGPDFDKSLTSGGLWVQFENYFMGIGEWRYYNSTTGKANQIASGNSLTLHVNYTPVEQPTTGVIITDDIINSGTLVPSYNGDDYAPDTITYKWYRNGSSTEIVPQKVDGELTNVDETSGEWLNVALDIESLCQAYPNDDAESVEARNNIRKTQYTYKVEAYIGDELIGEATYTVPYYAQLMNGSFEESDNEGCTYWETTTDNSRIEIGDYYDDGMGVYGTQYDRPSSGAGDKFAELNADSPGALYQDVLTVPGKELTWELAHRARNANGSGECFTPATDTMYVVIMSTKDADALLEGVSQNDQQDVLNTMIQSVLGNRDSVENATYTLRSGTNAGTEVKVTVTKITTTSRLNRSSYGGYTSNGQWESYNGDYIVPEGQYATRFFFASGHTQTGDESVGNLIDEVWFSPELPTPAPDTGHLTVTKVVTGDGLTAEALENYTVEVKVEGGSSDIAPQTISGFTSAGDGTFTASTTFRDLPAGTQYTVTETPSATPAGYDPGSSSYSIAGGTNGNGTSASGVTTTDGTTTELTFTNTYTAKQPLDLPYQKYVKANDDGTYDLTLNVTGNFEEGQTQTKDVDVLMILDTSGSMTENGSSRLSNAKAAMKSLIESLNAEKTVNAQYSIVRFDSVTDSRYGAGSRYDASTVVDWTKYSDFLLTRIDQIRSGNGTNYQAGLQEGASQLSKARDTATTVVIFLSDGTPSYANNQGYADDGYSLSSAAWQQTVQAAQALQCDRFYSIGIGSSVNKYLDEKTGIARYVNAATKQYIPSGDEQGTDLSTIFAGIAGSVNKVDCTNVAITDTLSNYAELTDDAKFKVSITDDKGEEVVSEEIDASQVTAAGTPLMLTYWTNNKTGVHTTNEPGRLNKNDYTRHDIEVTLTKTGKTFTLAFDPDYALERNWTYSITTQIEPTETAYTEYTADKAKGGNGYGNFVGDPNTDAPDNDTSSGKPGFYSNDSATLTYTSNSVTVPKEYPKPVIQVQPQSGNLTITKQVQGPEDVTLDATDATFTFTITTEAEVTTGEPGYTITGEGATGNSPKAKFTQVDGKYQATVTITGAKQITIADLPFGTYTVTETNAPDIGEYYCDLPDASNEVIGTDNLEAKVNISNTYEHYKTVIIQKQVDVSDNQSDIGMGDTTKLFKFTTSIQRGDNAGKAVTDANVANVNDKNSMTLDTDGKEVVEFEMSQPVGTAPDQRNTFDWWTGENGAAGYSLANGGYLKISKLKKGDTIAFNETDANSEGYTTSYVVNVGETNKKDNTYNATGHRIILTDEFLTTGEGAQAVLNDTVTIVYTNNRKVVTPTGLESNHTAPYTLMVTAAGIAGLALIGAVVNRRIRRRREE